MMNDLSARQTEIISLARVAGRVGVEELARRYDVTAQTIRKDLNELCDRHLLTRVHGGAIVSSGVENIAYDARRFVAAAEKRAIARSNFAPEPRYPAIAKRSPDRACARAKDHPQARVYACSPQ